MNNQYMKKILIAFSIAAVIIGLKPEISFARPYSRLKEIGFRFGLNLANLIGRDAKPPSGATKRMRPGVIFGGFLVNEMGDNVYFQPELNFSMRGAIYKTGDAKSEIILNYIEAPLLLRITFPTTDSTTHYIAFGPEINFLGKSGPNNYKGLDVGFVLDAGFSHREVDRAVSLDVRYSIGTMTIIRDIHARHSVFSIMIGFSIFPSRKISNPDPIYGW